MTKSYSLQWGHTVAKKDTLDITDFAEIFPLSAHEGAAFLLGALVSGGSGVGRHADFLKLLREQVRHLVGTLGPEASPETRFEQSMQELNGILQDWLAAHPGAVDIVKSGVLVMLTVRGSLVMTGFGQVHSLLVHRDASGTQTFDLLRDMRREKALPEKLFRSVLMGDMEAGDTAIFGTSAVFRLLPTEVLMKAVSLPPTSGAEHLRVNMESAVDGMAAVILKTSGPTESRARTGASGSVAALTNAEERTADVLSRRTGLDREQLARGASGVASVLWRALVLLVVAVVQTLAALGRMGWRALRRQKDVLGVWADWRKRLAVAAEPVPVLARVALVLLVVALGTGQVLGMVQARKAAGIAAVEARNGKVAQLQNYITDAEAKLIYRDEAGALQHITQAQNLLAAEKPLFDSLGVSADAERAILKLQREIRKEGVLTLASPINLPKPGKFLSLLGSVLLATSTDGTVYKGTAELAALATDFSAAVSTGDELWLADTKGNVTELKITAATEEISGALPTDIVSPVAFSSRIYALSPLQAQIVRIDLASSGFGKPKNWVTRDEIALKDARSMVIDGDVYVLTPTTVMKFAKGVRVNTWSLGTFSPALTDASLLRSSEDGNRLYVYERSSNRLLVFKKTGEFEKQYSIEGGRDFADFTVDETSKTGYFLQGSTVYSVKIP